MQVLISCTSLDEVRDVVALDVDIIDIKNPAEGSLGAPQPGCARDMAAFARQHGIPASAALGDLAFQPGTAALAAFGAAHLGVSYVKAGLHGVRSPTEAAELLDAIRRAVQLVCDDTAIVACGYADYRGFGGLEPGDLVRAAAQTHCEVVMLDTAQKGGASLFSAMSYGEVESFVRRARAATLKVALAGSLRTEHLSALGALDVDIVGVRGALCHGNVRNDRISVEQAREFIRAVRAIGPSRARPARRTGGMHKRGST